VSPTFLDLDQIIALHLSMIERYGGSDGLRDLGLLQSAMAMPQASFGGEYLHKDIFEMAAAYLFHIVKTIRSLMATNEPARRRPWSFSP